MPFRAAKLFLVPRPPAPEGGPLNEPKACTVVKCPLCEGRGEMGDHELLTRLREKDVAAKMANYSPRHGGRYTLGENACEGQELLLGQSRRALGGYC